MSDAVVAPTSPPILHRDETAEHLKFIGDNTFAQLQLMREGASKAIAGITRKPKQRKTPDLSVFDELGIPIEELKESTKELKKSNLKASLAQADGIKTTKKLYDDFYKSLSTYESDIKKFASIGGPKSILTKYVEKREKEIFNNYSRLQETVADSMNEITENVKSMTSKTGQAQLKQLEVIAADMKRVTEEDNLFKKKEKADKKKERKEKQGEHLEKIFDNLLKPILGPLNLIVEPLGELAGFDFGESIKKKFGLFGREKKAKRGEESEVDLMLGERKQFPNRNNILHKITGGVAIIWLRDELAKLMGKGKEGEEKGDLLNSLMGGGSGGLMKGLISGAGGLLPLLGYAAIGGAIIAGVTTALIKKWDILAPSISKDFIKNIKSADRGPGQKALDIGGFLFKVIFGTLAGGVRNVYQNSFGWIGDVWGGNNKDPLIKKIFKTIANVAKFAVLGPAGSLMEGELKTFGKFVMGLIPDSFKDFVSDIFGKIQKGFANLFKPFSDFFDAIGKLSIGDIAKGVLTGTLGKILEEKTKTPTPQGAEVQGNKDVGAQLNLANQVTPAANDDLAKKVSDLIDLIKSGKLSAGPIQIIDNKLDPKDPQSKLKS